MCRGLVDLGENVYGRGKDQKRKKNYIKLRTSLSFENSEIVDMFLLI